MKCPTCFHEHTAKETVEAKITLGSGRRYSGPICVWCYIGDPENDPY